MIGECFWVKMLCHRKQFIWRFKRCAQAYLNNLKKKNEDLRGWIKLTRNKNVLLLNLLVLKKKYLKKMLKNGKPIVKNVYKIGGILA